MSTLWQSLYVVKSLSFNHSVVRVQGDYFFRSFNLIIVITKERKDMRNIENIIIKDIVSYISIPATSFLFCKRDADDYHPVFIQSP